MPMKKLGSRKLTICIFLILFLFSFLSSSLFSKGLVKLSEAKDILIAQGQDVAKDSYNVAENDSNNTYGNPPTTEMSPSSQGDVLSQ